MSDIIGLLQEVSRDVRAVVYAVVGRLGLLATRAAIVLLL